jgi:cysteinyl-tRNA synthetase
MNLQSVLLTNTQSSKKEPLETQKSGVVRIYACGPTVYGYTHVGNARAALTVDLIVRVLRLANYKVEWARNITDIDDKIIKVAAQTGKTWSEVARFYEQAFLTEMKQLGVLEPTHLPRATDYIPAMIEMIQGLIQKDHAYVAATPFGSDVYFKVRSFREYGKLSHRNTEEMLAGTRIAPGESKLDPLDFALWKASKPGEPSWDSPWGGGRPGWHIECSAMIWKHFPDGLDIHAGGLDLVFPHHENEIAQSESYCGCALSRHWIHNGMLTVEREKMSKSIGNIFSTQDFLAQYGPEVLRLLCLLHHYRGPIDFSPETIEQAESILGRLYAAKAIATKISDKTTASIPNPPQEFNDAASQVRAALFDDFNSAKALGIVLKSTRAAFREQRAEVWGLWKDWLPLLNETLGILSQDAQQALEEMRKRRKTRWNLTDDFVKNIESLMLDRQSARASKDFKASDRIRDELMGLGVRVMDGPDGASWVFEGNSKST